MSVPSYFVWVPTALLVAVAMDLWAGFLHGRFWHRVLFPIHRTHHLPRKGTFEANDALSVLHAPIAIALILYGCRGPVGIGREVAFGVGLGASVFGLAYLLVHDGLVHRRLSVRWLSRIPGIRRVVNAHRVHHAGVEGGPPYSLFFGPLELARHRRFKRSGQARPSRPVPSAPRSNGQPPRSRAPV